MSLSEQFFLNCQLPAFCGWDFLGHILIMHASMYVRLYACMFIYIFHHACVSYELFSKQQVHFELRKWLQANVSPEVAATTRIIYGGIFLHLYHLILLFIYPFLNLYF